MYIEVHGTKLYYEVHGAGQPLLALHGMMLDHHAMMGALEPIFARRDGWQRIYLDLPAMGQSPAPDWLETTDQVLDITATFVEQVIPNQPYCVAGWSYGAYIARGLLHRHFGRINGLLLFAPTVNPNVATRDVPEMLVLERDEDALNQIQGQFRQLVEANVVLQNRYVLQRVRNQVAIGVARADQNALKRLQAQRGYSFDVNALPDTFRQPVLVVTGRHDSGVGYREAGDLIPQYPRSTFVVLDRAGHSVHIEQETLFNALVHEWLERVEAMPSLVRTTL